jgi:hypothetical protein
MISLLKVGNKSARVREPEIVKASKVLIVNVGCIVAVAIANKVQ